MARLGTADARFDSNTWHDVMDGRTTPGACDQEKKRQSAIPHRKTRVGEFHCIEPVPQTFAMLKEGREKIGLDDKNFVLTHAAISSRDGTVQFPDGVAGVESFGIDYCNKKNGTNTGTLSHIGETGMASDINCIEVATYSLDKYVAKYVRSKGPINTLQIDVEGFDFDVLFGAGSVLDRTYYLEFEHHIEGSWGQLHLQDGVKLLDGKGFTCYWAGKGGNIWRITKCYSEVYDGWHGWSNIVCVPFQIICFKYNFICLLNLFFIHIIIKKRIIILLLNGDFHLQYGFETDIHISLQLEPFHSHTKNQV